MKLVVNGATEIVEPAINLSEFLRLQGYPTDAIVIEHNGNIVRQPAWPTLKLSENDTLEILRFVGGG